MAAHNRSATCAQSGKRLRRKSWYYRDGKYFYNKRAWKTAKEKGAEASASQAPAQ